LTNASIARMNCGATSISAHVTSAVASRGNPGGTSITVMLMIVAMVMLASSHRLRLATISA
jgi:hypothetical protein